MTVHETVWDCIQKQWSNLVQVTRAWRGADLTWSVRCNYEDELECWKCIQHETTGDSQLKEKFTVLVTESIFILHTSQQKSREWCECSNSS